MQLTGKILGRHGLKNHLARACDRNDRESLMPEQNVFKAAEHLNIKAAGIIHHRKMSAAYRHAFSFLEIEDCRRALY